MEKNPIILPIQKTENLQQCEYDLGKYYFQSHIQCSYSIITISTCNKNWSTGQGLVDIIAIETDVPLCCFSSVIYSGFSLLLGWGGCGVGGGGIH